MPNSIDRNGFHRVRYPDLRAEVAERFKGEFGDDIKTDQQSAFGQFVTAYASAEDDAGALVGSLLQMLDPYSAKGKYLDSAATLMGTRRILAEKSTVSLSITNSSQSDVVVNAGFRATTTSGSVTFETTTTATIKALSTETLDAISTLAGAYDAPTDTVVVIVTPISGISSVSNADAAATGRFRETDPVLRSRIIANSSQTSTTITGIYNALAGIDGVSHLQVYESKQTGGAPGQPPHSIFPVLVGGDDDEIAETLITKCVAAGIAYTSPTDIPNATFTQGFYRDPISGQNHSAWWARPAPVRTWAHIAISTDPATFPQGGITLIKSAVAAWANDNLRSNDDLLSFELYCPVSSIEGIQAVTGISVSRDDPGAAVPPAAPWVQSVSILQWEYASLTADDVMVVQS